MTCSVHDYIGVHACNGVIECCIRERCAYDSCAHDGRAVTNTFLMILSVSAVCCSGDVCHCLPKLLGKDLLSLLFSTEEPSGEYTACLILP